MFGTRHDDPFIQQPNNTQNLNRYSYVLNNPLNATDPSGYFFQMLVVWAVQYIAAATATTAIGTALSVALTAYSYYGYAQMAVGAIKAIEGGGKAMANFAGGVAKGYAKGLAFSGLMLGLTHLQNSVNKSTSSPDNAKAVEAKPGSGSSDGHKGVWTDQAGNSIERPANFDGTETACLCLGTGFKNEQQVANDQAAAAALTKSVKELAGSFSSPPPDEPPGGNEDFIKKPTSKLGRNLEANGMPRPGNEYEAHHMIPTNVKEAAQARAVLQKYNIDINSHANGVWLPQNVHRGPGGLHSNNRLYGEAVSTRLRYASSRESAEAILRGIRSDLRNGVNFWK